MTMSTRFCTRCNVEVDDTGGFCILGHSLALQPMTKDLAHLRIELDEAFEQARREATGAPLPADGPRLSPPAPPARPSASAPATPPNELVDGIRERAGTIWAALDEIPPEDDPIAAFAPPPRMDWGPERLHLRGKPRASVPGPSGVSA
jgi:hypothetical protein